MTIQRYTLYSRLTNDYYQQYPALNQGTGLLDMLSLIDDNNPIIRYQSRVWLNESQQYLFRILDPLLELMIQEQHHGSVQYRQNMPKQFVYMKPYNTHLILQIFENIKNMMNILKQGFYEFLVLAKISNKMLDTIRLFKLEKNFKNENEISYLDVFILEILSYIQGQSDDSIDKKFQKDNATINANSCELLEQMILLQKDSDTLVQKYSTTTLQKILLKLIQMLQYFICDKNDVLQVQLLSLLSVIIG